MTLSAKQSYFLNDTTDFDGVDDSPTPSTRPTTRSRFPSPVRRLFGAYSGKLYQVRNTANATKDILTLTPGGFADGPSQDTFCAGTTCVTTVLYDQSGHGNDLWYRNQGLRSAISPRGCTW